MVKKIEVSRVYCLMIGFLFLILLTSSVSALNAKVGNGKFVISNATVGDVIERTMKIYNDNSFDVRIELIPSGNLSEYIKILDTNFTMAPNSEKEARFSVKVPNVGRNDGEIDVKFIAANMTENGKNGVVIPTTMIIFAQKGTGGIIDWTSWFGGGDKNNTNTNKTGTDSGTGDSGSGIGMFEILFIVTAIIFIVLLILLYLYSKSKNRGVKEGKREKLNTKKKEK